jgi:hypothetical protein
MTKCPLRKVDGRFLKCLEELCEWHVENEGHGASGCAIYVLARVMKSNEV